MLATWRHRVARVTPASAAGVVVALTLLVAGCGSAADGADRPPPSLDPASPVLVAEAIAFDRSEVTAPADAPFVLVLENRDAASHNVSIYGDPALADRRFEGALFSGPATRWYRVPALAPGTYTFLCDLHPSMRGTLTAS